ncbi:unnamed protein product [Mucor circinelloides]|uniref:Uncharacterized protein n=1 Tax=Mucor circinelloides f. circinelloides (strain 1006PhL) TaxID=1220926 RepID=S2K8X3_MUCC1|nr:hypothetical protein HMPREF1544_01372 [Mucor circinelloides 1006PhL]
MHQPPVLPLTEENLLNLSSNNNEMLERYCQEMTLNRVRCQSTPPQLMTQQQQKNSDIVVASPRILPFPYHNDSMFLPTAEQIQYQMASSCYDNFSSSGTSRADSSSSIIPPSPSFMSRPKRPQSTNTNIRGSSNYSVSSISHHQHQYRGRRSLPARLDSLVMTNSFSKHRFLRRSSSCSSFGSSSVSSLEVVENNYAHQQQVQPQHHLSHTKKPWLKRIFKFFNKNTKQEQQQQQQHQDGNPVWYCQYSKNPTSRFEKYYNQKQMIIVS